MTQISSNVTLGGHNMTLSGSSVLTGTVSGGGDLVITGIGTIPDTSTISYGLYLTNSATLVDAGTIVDTGGLFLGASETATDSSSLIIDASAVFIDAGNVIQGSYPTPDTFFGLPEPGSIINAGLFEATISEYDSRYYSNPFFNTGTILVNAGDDFGLTGGGTLGGTITGAGEFDLFGGNYSLSANLVVNVATFTAYNYNTDSTAGGGEQTTVALGGNLDLTQSVQIGATVLLNGHNLTLAGSSALSGSISGGGDLVVTGTATIPDTVNTSYSLNLTNNATLVDAGTIVDTSGLLLGASETATDSSSLIIDSGAVFIDAGGVTEGDYTTPDTFFGIPEPGSITNAGLYEVALSEEYSNPFFNTGTILVKTGDDFGLTGGGTLGGTITGAGSEFDLFGGNYSLLPGLVVNVATFTAYNEFNDSTAGTDRITTVALGANLDLTQSVQIGASIVLNTHNLTLAGSSLLNQADIFGNGATGNTLLVTGHEIQTISNTLETGVTLVDAGSIAAEGYLYLNGSSSLIIDAGATYDLVDVTQPVFNIAQPAGIIGTTGSVFQVQNAGLLELTGLGKDTFAVSIMAPVLSTGTIEINDGQLTLAGSSVLSGTITGPGTLVVTGTAEGLNSTISSSPFELYLLNDVTLVDAGTIFNEDLVLGNGSATDSSGLIIEANAVYNLGDGDVQGFDRATITNAGVFAATKGGDIEADFINTGTISVAAGAVLQFDYNGLFGGTLAGAGELLLQGSTVTLEAGLVDNAASLVLANGITVAGNLNFANYVEFAAELAGHTVTLAGNSEFDDATNGTLLVTGSDTIGYAMYEGRAGEYFIGGDSYLQNYATLVDSGSISEIGNLHLGGGTALDGSSLIINSGAVYNVVTYNASDTEGPQDIQIFEDGGKGSISNAGLFESTGGPVTISPSFINSGTILAAGGGSIDFHGGVTNTGTIIAAGSDLTFASGISGTGLMDIAAAGEIILQSSLAAGSTIGFLDDTGTLALSDPFHFGSNGLGLLTAGISGLRGGDVLEIAGTAVSAVSFGAHALTVTSSAGTFDFNNVTYGGTITGYSVAADATTGLEAITFSGTGPSTLALFAPTTESLTPALTTLSGVALGDSNPSPGETFKVVLYDGHGLLSATGATVSSNGKAVTLTGSLAEVRADLKTLTDTDLTAGADNIIVTASDSLFDHATPVTIAVSNSGLVDGPLPVPVTAGQTSAYLVIGAGGEEDVDGGTANSTTIAGGGVQYVYGGGTNYSVIAGGVEIVEGGSTATNTQIKAGGVEDVSGTSVKTTVFQGGTEYVGNTGTAANTTITYDGAMDIEIGGTATGAITFAGSNATLSVAGTVLPSTEISGFDQNTSTDLIILTSFIYAAGKDTASLGSGNVLTLDLNGKIEKLSLNPSQSYAGHSFAVTTNSLDQVVVIDPTTNTKPAMDFLTPAASTTADVTTRISGRNAALMHVADTSYALKPAFKTLTNDPLNLAAASNLASLNQPSGILSISKLNAHAT